MKLLRLVIRNLASIEEADLDFTQAPLQNAPLFLICGATGSGKTTLLDAVCLALFATTPRLRDAGRSKGYYDGALSAADSRNLLRRGAAEASVALTFEADDGRRYTSTWSARRTRTSRMDNYKLILTGPQGVESEQIKSSLDRIAALIGMGFDQFCRTVMLAQGDFTRFLKSDKASKGAILEQITRTEQYRKVGRVVHQQCQEAKKKLETTSLRLAQETMLDGEARQQLESATGEAAQREAQQRQQVDALRRQTQWRRRYDDALQREQQSVAELQRCTAEADSDAFRAEVAALDDWEKSREARLHLARQEALQQQMGLLDRQREEGRARFVTLCATNEKVADGRRQLEQRQAETVAALQAEANRAPMYDHLQTVESLLRSAARDRDERRQTEVRLQQLQQATQGKEQVLTEANRLLREAEKGETEVHGRYEAAQKELQRLNPEQLTQQRAHCDASQQRLRRVAEQLATLGEARRDASQRSRECAELQSTRQARLDEAARLAQQEPAAREALKRATTRFEAVSEALGDYVSRLRTHLHEGDTCPVCGSRVSRLVTDAELQAQLAPLAAERQTCEAQLLRLLSDQSAARRTADDLLRQWNDLDQRRQADELRAQSALDRVGEEARRLLPSFDGSEASVAELQQELASQQQLWEQTQADLQRRQDAVDAQNRELHRLNTEWETCRQATRQALQSAQTAQTEVETHRLTIGHLQSTLDTLRVRMDDTMRRVDELMRVADWRTKWDNHADDFLRDLSSRAVAYRTMQDQSAENVQRLDRARDVLLTVEDSRRRVVGLWPDWAGVDLADVAPVAASHLVSDWQQFASDMGALHAQQETTRRNMEEERHLVSQFLTATPGFDLTRLHLLSQRPDMEAVRERHLRHTSTLNQLQGAHRQAVAQRMQVQSEPHDAATLDATPLQLEEQLAQGEQRLNATQDELRRLRLQIEQDDAVRLRHARVVEERDALQAEFEDWKTLDTMFGGEQGQQFCDLAQRYLLNSLLQGANRYLEQLNGRYQLESMPDELVIGVRDTFQSETCHPADTLSGGESFLVSLSLALALASLGQKSLSIDTIFIDEGFGTLSDDRLDTVVNLLSHLPQIHNRRVGVISHVRELQERIPVHVEVTRVDNSRSRVAVRDTTL
ncbi:MAG: AAA family ATPase [Bacteroidales bacterium]|nr:AAA family ATPase [Bacteroidales bacterium]